MQPTSNAAAADIEWDAEQFFAAGREAYRSLQEQHGSVWPAIRQEISESRWKLPNGELRRSIPGKYDTELMDVVEGIYGKSFTEDEWRRAVRNGFWSQLDAETEE